MPGIKKKTGWLMALPLVVVVAACQPATDESLPTLAVLPSATVTETPAPPTETSAPTFTPEPSATPTETQTSTPTFTPTVTQTPTDIPIPTETPDATLAAAATGTAAVLEAPRFSTLTPVPAGASVRVRPTSTGTPLVNADVLITQTQFQEEVDRLIAGIPEINALIVDFVPGGIDLRLTASGGQALISGTFFMQFALSEGGLNNVLIVQPVAPDLFRMPSGLFPPDDFIDVAYGQATPVIFEVFGLILNQRLGEGQHDLEAIVIDDNAMAITLLVPQPS